MDEGFRRQDRAECHHARLDRLLGTRQSVPQTSAQLLRLNTGNTVTPLSDRARCIVSSGDLSLAHFRQRTHLTIELLALTSRCNLYHHVGIVCTVDSHTSVIITSVSRHLYSSQRKRRTLSLGLRRSNASMATFFSRPRAASFFSIGSAIERVLGSLTDAKATRKVSIRLMPVSTVFNQVGSASVPLVMLCDVESELRRVRRPNSASTTSSRGGIGWRACLNPVVVGLVGRARFRIVARRSRRRHRPTATAAHAPRPFEHHRLG